MTFVEHLHNQPRVSRTGTDVSAMSHVGEDVTASTSASQTAGDGSISSPLGGTAPPLAPPRARLDEQPQRSTQNRVPALSWGDTNDGLLHGRTTTRALEQVREASSRHAAMRVDATEPPSTASVEEDSLADTSGGVATGEIVLLVDVEDPDVPDWCEALESSKHNKWLEGTEAELTSLQEMGIYKLVSCSEVPTNHSI